MLASTIVVSLQTTKGGNDRETMEPNGVLLVDKPVGITSHDVVDHVRKLYGIRRVGHTGTLDPIASGLMIVLLGQGTKIASYLTELDKVYCASIRFGAVSDTGDSHGNLAPKGDPASVDTDRLHPALSSLVGERALRIPAFSAVRVGGQRLYELARRGVDVPSLERDVTVYRAELLSYDPPVAEVRFHCSSGTYVRSLAESLGEAVGCGAHLSGLRREAVGRWRVESAVTLDRLSALEAQGTPLPAPEPIERFLDYPQIEVQSESVATVSHGSPITVDRVQKTAGTFNRGDVVVVCDEDHRILAVGEALLSSDELASARSEKQVFSYRRVLI